MLISQDYLSADDERLLGGFARHFQDPRYIRIEGRPLLMVYRPRHPGRASDRALAQRSSADKFSRIRSW